MTASLRAPGLAAATVTGRLLDKPSLRKTFTAFCDTLVPADDLTPSASRIGVPSRILDAAQGDELYTRLIGAGCRWLEEQAAGDFAALSEAQRDAILRAMNDLPWEAPARRFVYLVRDHVMSLYYADPASWPGLPFDRPPQPLGFPQSVP